jgi:hypothetical protein
VTHAYNPRYLRGIQRIDICNHPVEKVRESAISTNEPGIVVSACKLRYRRGIGRRISVRGWPQAKV